MNAAPQAITLNVKENLLTITWGDGRVSRYLGAYLRHVCPCAECRGHAPGEKEPPSWQMVRDVKVTGAKGVGTYALQFDLSDGHTTGIYSYGWLREQDPAPREDCDDVGVPQGHAQQP
ncbi:MAG: DUF971 domain-containing protein [Planctomycetota bacterium]|nr:DUF971 domain-containing protein [Planctomycetota bacterium]